MKSSMCQTKYRKIDSKDVYISAIFILAYGRSSGGKTELRQLEPHNETLTQEVMAPVDNRDPVKMGKVCYSSKWQSVSPKCTEAVKILARSSSE